jgi:inosine-uridine nucleoside N-ribohydrolase
VSRTDEPPAVHRPRVVVDCDPGHDDIVALVLAAAECDVAAITTVAGNAPLEHTTRNALVAAEVLGLEVGVHPGADRPLVRPARHGAGAHGYEGLEGVAVPAPRREPAGTRAVEALLEVSRATEGLWVLATGPLTNVAVALRADPTVADRLAGISLMGGGLGSGNVTPAAEFNLWFDPEAAAAVFDSGVPIRMCGLDVTQQVPVGPLDAERFRSLGGPLADLVGDVVAGRSSSAQAASGTPRAPLHDPCAVAALTHPELFGFEHLHVEVETQGRVTEGMAVADRRTVRRGWAGHPNAHVALSVDADGVLALVRSALVQLAR